MSSFQFNQDNEADDRDIVTLTDSEGRTLECYVEKSLDTDDTTYLLLTPTDIPVVILAWDEETETQEEELSDAIILEDNEEIEQVFADAKAVLAELDLTLKHTALTLTIEGELPPLEEDEILTLELDEDDTSLESEELQCLASFYHQDQKYSIYTPLDPLLFLAKYNHLGQLEIVSSEDEEIQPILEDLLFEELE
jgi:hypothetical protein